MLYDDGGVVCDDTGIRIRWYYPWGAKAIPYSAVRGVLTRPLSRVRGRWRLWGSGDFTHWYNLDLGRPGKSSALELDLGRRVIPTITPDEPETVARIIRDHQP